MTTKYPTGNLTVRPPAEQRILIERYAEKHNISIAKAILSLVDIGLEKAGKQQGQYEQMQAELAELRREIEALKKRMK